jgi:hypothetical protein
VLRWQFNEPANLSIEKQQAVYERMRAAAEKAGVILKKNP